MDKPHLLYLAFFFPPSRSSGVYRAMATVRAFHEAGWRVTVITADERFFEDELGPPDYSLLDSIPLEVGIERVPFSLRLDQPTTDVREFGWFRANFPHLWAAIRNRMRLPRRILDVLRGRSPLSYPMTDRYLAWIEPVVNRARDLYERDQFDHVLATGNPYSAFEAARLIAGMKGVDFTIDYRDPWAFDMRTGSPARLTPATFAAEKRIIDEAHACIHVNSAIAKAYADRYPEDAHKQHVVVNGYDRESVPPLPAPAEGPITFGMLGTVTDLWPLGPLFEAWHLTRDRLPDGSRLLLGGHLGYFPHATEMLRSSFPGPEDGFSYEGPIPKTEVAKFYGRLDVALVPLFGGPMVTAGKILEVAALGMPIVCVQGKDGGARRFYESNHPLAISVDPDPGEIVDALVEAARLARETGEEERAQVRKEMARFERLNAMRSLVEIVSGALTGAAPR